MVAGCCAATCPRARQVVRVGGGRLTFVTCRARWAGSDASPVIQKEVHLSNTLVGLLGTSFPSVYAFAALPFGCWAERGVRKTVVGVDVPIGRVARLFTG